MAGREQFHTERRGFFQRHGLGIGILVVAVVGVIAFRKLFSGEGGGPPRKTQEMVMIKPTPPPLPPPPPPPPPQQMEPKQQMMEQTPLENEEPKPEAPPDPSPSLGTNVKGNGRRLRF